MDSNFIYLAGLGLPFLMHLKLSRSPRLIRQKAPFPLNYLISRIEYKFMGLFDGGIMGYGFLGRFPKSVMDFIANRLVIPAFSSEIITHQEAVNAVRRLEKEGYHIALGQCICRRGTNKIAAWDGTGFDPNRTCIMIHNWARGHRFNTPHLFAPASAEEVVEVLKHSVKQGKINEVFGCFNAPNSLLAICNCLPEYCVPLKGFQLHNYLVYGKGYGIVVHDEKKCLGIEKCGLCLERCQFGAIRGQEGNLEVSPAQCYGCGICIEFCPAKAMQLIPRVGRVLHYAPPELVAPL